MEGDEEIDLIQIDEEPLISKASFYELLEFFSHRDTIHDFNSRFENMVGKECRRGIGSCTLELLEVVSGKRSIDLDKLYVKDPVEYVKVVSNVKEFLVTNPECARCMKTQEKEIEGVLSTLKEVVLIKRGIKDNSTLQNGTESKSFDLLNQSLLNHALSRFKKSRNLAPGKEIDRYFLASSTIIEACISQIEGQNEKMYDLVFHLPFTEDFLRILRRGVDQDLDADQLLHKMEKFEEVLNKVVYITRKRIIHDVILEKTKDIDLVVLLISFSVLGLGKLFPLLVDENIEEVFLDSPEGSLYIHHVAHQHCRTTVFLTMSEIQSVISRLRMETDKNLNDLFPSLKCVIKNDYFYTRFNVDVKPLNPLGFSLDIRRLNKKVFDIIDLIHLGTFNIEIAAFLVFCLHSRLNLTITGKTDSGKTTLLNALDMLYPQQLRKIYVEDEIETLNQDPMHYHQLKFKTTSKERKSDLIKNLLHRSPEVLILGEILTREETDAMFHCLSTGMRGLQTIHANTIASLITRFRIHFNISTSCFADLDFVFLLKKFENGQRKLVEIAEFNHTEGGEGIASNVLVAYDPKGGDWSALNFGDSKVMDDFFASTKFDHVSFNEYLEAVKVVIAKSIKRSEHTTPEFVKELNQVYIGYRDYF